MAFERLNRVKVVTRQARKSQKSQSRYAGCDLVVDGDIQRLAFRRYAEYDLKTRSTQRSLGSVNPGSESRLDEVARVVYGDFRSYWALFMFNRWLGINPLRFPSQYVIAIPYAQYIQGRLSARGVNDA